ncbi:MAG: enterochelin esterase [Gammaproteobacteria bacterium]|nr:enterochelin esterase [Gammaproteobacteria bacterium]MBU1506600.1 enterochelin esterase [Gammaproteobacteria bacterium]MBU2121566.1 enterochelin esterase [Gammaproteobacteria bacterium]MBU2170412.1 enterochelin esterase [Gammaproteobacteria bacterium]MBU2199531.1 enterochelin esterase [Gammaproteobacteria bacterium]
MAVFDFARALACAAALVGMAQAAGAEALAVGTPAQGSLAPGQVVRWPVQAPAGQVVQGDFDAPDAMLDVIGAEGRHLRRLVGAGGGPQGFTWQVQPGEQLQVRAGPQPQGSAYTLNLRRALALAPAAPASAESPLPSPRLRALARTLAEGGSTAAFWQERAQHGTPLVEPLSERESLVTFLWRGTHATQSVRLFGSPSGNHDPLQQLPGSDLWWASFRMPLGARLSYRLAPDVPQVQGSAQDNRRMILATAQRDPLNARAFPARADAALDAFQGASVLELPAAPPQPWVAPRPSVAQGTITRHEIASRILGNQRPVWLYRPAGAPPQALLVVFDAHAYREDVPTPRIVDNLMADGLIPPTAVLMVSNPSAQARATELPPNPLFARFLDEELMPWVQTQGLGQPPEATVIAGSSFGGLASAYAGLMLPQRFGRVLSLSGSYWWAPQGELPGWMMRAYAAAPSQDVRFYLDAGRYEGARGGQSGILETNRHLGDVLRAKGYAVTHREHATGHDYLHWQGALGCGLVALLNPARFAQDLPVCDASAPPT